MNGPRFVLSPLMAALALSCVLPAHASADAAPEPARETIERHWPDGTLRERKHAIRLPDGTTVDDGAFERWFHDGTKEYEAFFVRGRKEGTTVRYHRNGRPASRQSYRNGARHGPSVSWNQDGERVKEENWADGRPHGTWTIWKDGRVAWMHTFDHGDPDP